jgi:hypothetical protein
MEDEWRLQRQLNLGLLKPLASSAQRFSSFRVEQGRSSRQWRSTLCQLSGALSMSATHADAPFLRRVLAVLVLSTMLSGAISGIGVLRLSNADAEIATAAYGK